MLKDRLAEVEATNKLVDGWDTYGAPAPNDVSRERASLILRELSTLGLEAEKAIASGEGGIALVYSSKKEGYADVEIYNDGEIIAIMSRPRGPQPVWVVDLDNLTDLADRFKKFIAETPHAE